MNVLASIGCGFILSVVTLVVGMYAAGVVSAVARLDNPKRSWGDRAYAGIWAVISVALSAVACLLFPLPAGTLPVAAVLIVAAISGLVLARPDSAPLRNAIKTRASALWQKVARRKQPS